MSNNSWKDIAELVGITAIVLSLLFVGFQIRQSQQLAMEEQINNANERQNAIRELIFAYPEIWHKACTGEPLDPVSRVIAAKIFDSWIDHVAGEYTLRASGVRQSEASRQKIVEEIAAQYWLYPGLEELGNSRLDWHQGAVVTNPSRLGLGILIRERLDELRSNGIKPKGDTAWCGRT